MAGYGRADAELAAERFRRPASLAPKDYSVPLHVDCSIEYELPDCAKPPQGVKIEPLLMIHPAHFRRLESLRRVPFVNNLPQPAAAAPASQPAPGRARRCCRAAPAPAAPPPAPAQAQRRREAAGAAGPPPVESKRPARARPYLAPPARPYERWDARALQQLPVFL